MKNLFIKVKEWVKNHKIISAIIIVVVIVAVFFLGKKNSNTERIAVKVGTVVETVQASGKTKAAEDANLGFVRSGKVSKVYVKIGDSVRAGDILVALDQGEEYANLLKAQAELSSETSKLDDVQVAFADAKLNLISKINDAYTKSDDALRNYSDQFFSGTAPSLSFRETYSSNGTNVTVTVDPALRLSLISKRSSLNDLLHEWGVSILGMGPSSDLDKYLADAKKNLNTVKIFLDELSLAVNNSAAPSQEFSTIFASQRSDVSTARTNINTALTNLLDSIGKYNSAKLEVGMRNQSISAQESKILSNKANVQASEAVLSQMIIRAPFDGLITSSDISVGEIVDPGKNVISIISKNNLEIESNVSEVNIGKIQIGNSVNITLDAFPGQVFGGKVTYIEPAATIVDNVVTYKVTVAINEQNKELKSGLTANLVIETIRKESVVNIPQYAVTSRNGKSYVQKIENNKTIETEVMLGVKGSNGIVEVLSGISEGDALEVGIITQ
jgi:multidrug efflux pump subunit AcrA (membrane-fusion protein)